MNAVPIYAMHARTAFVNYVVSCPKAFNYYDIVATRDRRIVIISLNVYRVIKCFLHG